MRKVKIVYRNLLLNSNVLTNRHTSPQYLTQICPHQISTSTLEPHLYSPACGSCQSVMQLPVSNAPHVICYNLSYGKLWHLYSKNELTSQMSSFMVEKVYIDDNITQMTVNQARIQQNNKICILADDGTQYAVLRVWKW